VADWRIDPLSSSDEIDSIMAVEAASFFNPWTRAMYEAELRNEGVAFFFLARDKTDRVVGFCSFWRILDELHINNLAVIPDARRSGIGSALLARVLDEARDMGASRALLEVRRSNEAARRLYERFGFTTAGVRHGYYSDPVEDAIVLWREHLERGAPWSRS
jgi:ribosomal-protein-alanine N-acetyltransferase